MQTEQPTIISTYLHLLNQHSLSRLHKNTDQDIQMLHHHVPLRTALIQLQLHIFADVYQLLQVLLEGLLYLVPTFRGFSWWLRVEGDAVSQDELVNVRYEKADLLFAGLVAFYLPGDKGKCALF